MNYRTRDMNAQAKTSAINHPVAMQAAASQIAIAETVLVGSTSSSDESAMTPQNEKRNAEHIAERYRGMRLRARSPHGIA